MRGVVIGIRCARMCLIAFALRSMTLLHTTAHTHIHRIYFQRCALRDARTHAQTHCTGRQAGRQAKAVQRTSCVYEMHVECIFHAASTLHARAARRCRKTRTATATATNIMMRYGEFPLTETRRRLCVFTTLFSHWKSGDAGSTRRITKTRLLYM